MPMLYSSNMQIFHDVVTLYPMRMISMLYSFQFPSCTIPLSYTDRHVAGGRGETL